MFVVLLIVDPSSQELGPPAIPGRFRNYAKLVDERNKTAHSNGNILFNSEAELQSKVNEILKIVTEIQDHSEAIIVDGYKRFLIESADPEEREHIETSDQVREVLIHEGYMSLIDLDFCAKSDIAEFEGHPHFAEIEALHAEVKGWVPDEESLAA